MSSTLSQDTALGGGGKSPISYRHPYGMCSDWDEAGPNWEGQGGALEATGVQVPCWRSRGGFLTWASSAEALCPHSTPETAEFLGEDLQQVHAWASHG